MSELTSAVRAAQADADRRFGDGPVQPWEPPPVLSPATRRRLAIAALTSLLATALLVAMAVARTAPPAAPPVAGEASEPELPLAADEAPRERGDGATRARAGETTAPAHLSLERHGAEWQLSATDASRLEAAQRLADASGSSLRGSPDAMNGIRPLDLQWRGRSLAQLWPLVLGPELNYALQCRRDRCEVWILGPARSTSSPVAAAALPSLADEPPVLAMPMPIPVADDDNAPGRD